MSDRPGDAAGDEMGSAGFFHGGTECEHAENHVENSPLDSAARFLDIEAAGEDDENRGDKRDRGNGQHVKRSEYNHAENSKDASGGPCTSSVSPKASWTSRKYSRRFSPWRCTVRMSIP